LYILSGEVLEDKERMNKQIPPIDLAIPILTETATFALG
jgi:hypothetical protein